MTARNRYAQALAAVRAWWQRNDYALTLSGLGVHPKPGEELTAEAELGILEKFKLLMAEAGTVQECRALLDQEIARLSAKIMWGNSIEYAMRLSGWGGYLKSWEELTAEIELGILEKFKLLMAEAGTVQECRALLDHARLSAKDPDPDSIEEVLKRHHAPRLADRRPSTDRANNGPH